MIAGFKQIAREERAKTLHVRIDCYKEELLQVMSYLYGKPTLKTSAKDVYEFSVRKSALKVSSTGASTIPKPIKEPVQSITAMAAEIRNSDTYGLIHEGKLIAALKSVTPDLVLPLPYHHYEEHIFQKGTLLLKRLIPDNSILYIHRTRYGSKRLFQSKNFDKIKILILSLNEVVEFAQKNGITKVISKLLDPES